MNRTQASETLFLSPHFDDVVLSCGGQLWQLARAGGAPRVVTIFAAARGVDAAGMPFAQQQHQMWGNPPRPVELRQAEDRAAGAQLGVQELVHLPFFDAVYRQTPAGAPLYSSDDELFGDVHPADQALPDQIIAALTPRVETDAPIVAPLGAGNHVDHQIVRTIGDRLLDAGYRVIFYEELPYVEASSAFDYDPTVGLEPDYVELNETSIAAKLRAMLYYRTQIPVLYGSPIRMIERVRQYAAHLAPAGACYAERRWISKNST